MSFVNLRQLAGELGLSSSTVSRAMRDSYEISTATRERVQTVARQLNYQPNPFAGSLRNNVTKTIAVILPQLDNHFFSLAINGIEEVAQQNGYHVLIYLTHDSGEQEKAVTKYLTSGRVDGILLALASGTRGVGHLEKLKLLGVPIVQFDRVSETLRTATVTTDDYASSYQATEHLIKAGCRTIAHLLVSESLSIGSKRLKGYQAALEAHRIPFDAGLVLNGRGSNDNNLRRITQLLEQRPEIDGIFAAVERLALSSYLACQRLGRAIPQDIKIVGFSNMETASLLAPSLTTITQPAYAIGKEAARILFQAIIKHKPVLPAHSLELKSELIARASTAGPLR
ncbi:LacI family DNA-binding transcriptional regulator [Hymenobacter negativus]|uniref:LacI family DNA-binding transcriptional regulator n=1 Tax=Hymenobacter negativus TaxID=2795026 RepID=A0ABS3QFT1_9BACT|nr:LacI family DNA-binding transcriptional regulator [Hymenobacter negativus]MBO2010109.1 LacI family DNA-binding transcriptional regulator [Hymenobacter negativus]